MKLPSLAIAVSFASGILAGGLPAANPLRSAVLCLAAGVILLACGMALFVARRENSAWIASLLAWCLLGAAAARLEPLGQPADRVTRVVSDGRLDLSAPLRWRGQLRTDPLELPWGARYEIDLEGVQTAGAEMPVAGGLRAEYFFDERAPHALPLLRAGDRVEVLLRARLLRNYGDPGAFDYESFFARQGIYLTGTLRSTELLERIPGATPTLAQRLARVRGRLLREVDAMLAGSPERTRVARAMLLGDRSFLDSEEVQAFQQTGSYHVLVLAGLHVGVLTAVLLWAGRKLRFSLPARTAMAFTAIVLYAAIIEDRPPIVRATLMAGAYLVGRLLFRRVALLNAVGLAAVAILAARPSELGDASFQLSFLAAATIGGVAAPLLERTAERYRRALDHLGDVTRDAAHSPRVTQFRLDARAVAKWLASHLPQPVSRLAGGMVTAPCRVMLRLWEIAVISATLQIGLTPLMAHYFHRVTWAGLAANVPAVLLTGVIVPLGFLSLGASVAWRALGHAMGRVLAAVIGVLVSSVDWFAGFGWASHRVPSPPAALLAFFFAAGAVLAFAMVAERRRIAASASILVLVATALIADYPFSPRLHGGRLEVTILDVGQGDSIFVAFPNGRTMLIDGGGLPGSSYLRGVRPGIDVGEDVVSTFLWARGLKRLDVVALTHAHEDHIGGLAAVLRNFRVGELWVGHDVDSRVYHALLDEARARGVPVIHRVTGDSLDGGGAGVHVLWPEDDSTVRAASNDDSLVLRLDDGREALLLTGDIERPVEQKLVAQSSALAADFLKVPHHGSRSSSTEEFLAAVHPRFAAISVGETNPFGQPNPEVLERLSTAGIPSYRTDRDGAITALTAGSDLNVYTFRGHPD